jgi:hypothetical protein
MPNQFMEAVGQHHRTIELEKSVFSEDFECVPFRELVIECITHHPYEIAEGFCVYERSLEEFFLYGDKDSKRCENPSDLDIKLDHKFYESFTDAMTDYKERKICLRQTLCVLSIGKKTYPSTDKKK